MKSGREIGGYRIGRLLGKGGMSEVYEAEHLRLGSRHAVKFFTYEKNVDGVKERFLAEGRLLARLAHPRIVRVTDVGTDAETEQPYFVMDLVADPEGNVHSLADVPAGGADEAQIAMWYDDLREGLAYIHAKGVIHRDLKLENVLIGPDGHAVLTDFGISKIGAAKDGDTVVDPVQTVIRLRDGKNPLMGSLGYMAPELEMGVAASPQSDYYALGVIVFRLLTGIWCDARTDVVGDLETYDPVWRQILPKLLHSNPRGRECLSYADEKRADREKAEFEAEERWLKEKARGHLARHVARYVGALAILLAAVLAWEVREFRVQREVWRMRLQNAGARPDVPAFDELFRVPATARADEQMNENGDVVMPSRGAFEAARLDALVLTHPVLSSLASGDSTIEKAIADLESMRDRLAEDSDNSPFDNLRFGNADYMQAGENEPLRMLLESAIEKLQEAAEK